MNEWTRLCGSCAESEGLPPWYPSGWALRSWRPATAPLLGLAVDRIAAETRCHYHCDHGHQHDVTAEQMMRVLDEDEDA